MSTNPNLLANVSSVAQDGVVILAAASAGAAVIVSALAVFGVHVDAADIVQKAGALGALLTFARTALDSLASKGAAATIETPKFTQLSSELAAGLPILAPAMTNVVNNGSPNGQ